jgi:ferredoxin
MRIVADTTRCVGAGQCVIAAPDVFDQTDDEGLVVVNQPEPADELMEYVVAAVAACPAQALSLER